MYLLSIAQLMKKKIMIILNHQLLKSNSISKKISYIIKTV